LINRGEKLSLAVFFFCFFADSRARAHPSIGGAQLEVHFDCAIPQPVLIVSRGGGAYYDGNFACAASDLAVGDRVCCAIGSATQVVGAPKMVLRCAPQK
jgi:hypothetical protein